MATDAGYTKGAFYANFKSKEELFLVMLDEKYAAELERLRELACVERGTRPRRSRAAAEEFIRFAWSDPQWPKLYFEFVAYAGRNPDFRKELLARDRAIRERMAEVIPRTGPPTSGSSRRFPRRGPGDDDSSAWPTDSSWAS